MTTGITVTCPNCGYVFKTGSLEGEQKFKCSHCSNEFSVKRFPASQKNEREIASDRIAIAARESKRTLVGMKINPILDKGVFDITDDDANELAQIFSDIAKEGDVEKMKFVLWKLVHVLAVI